MERKLSIPSLLILSVWAILLLVSSFESNAQNITYLNDKSKTYQLRSMEAGKWEFHPGWYYVSLHKKYSGGYWKGLNIKWDVNKSDVRQISPVRASEVELENMSAKRVQNQIDTVQSIAKEETTRSAERMVDAVYSLYADKFKEAFNGIDELTTIINEKSKGELVEDALAIIKEKDLLKSEIDYIHETGPTKQMEQAKRQLAYEEIWIKLQNLYDWSYKLAYFAHTLNNLNK